MRTMKQTVWTLCGMVFMGMSGYAMDSNCYGVAQEKPASLKEIPNPEKTARKRTDKMDEVLHLSKKQYKKIYKLLLKEEREKLERSMGRVPMKGMHPMPPMEGRRPPMRGSHPGGFGESPRGERPPMAPPADSRPDREKEAERIEKRTKKIRKILTDEQYDIWLTMPPESPVSGTVPSMLPPDKECVSFSSPSSANTCGE